MFYLKICDWTMILDIICETNCLFLLHLQYSIFTMKWYGQFVYYKTNWSLNQLPGKYSECQITSNHWNYDYIIYRHNGYSLCHLIGIFVKCLCLVLRQTFLHLPSNNCFLGQINECVFSRSHCILYPNILFARICK